MSDESTATVFALKPPASSSAVDEGDNNNGSSGDDDDDDTNHDAIVGRVINLVEERLNGPHRPRNAYKRVDDDDNILVHFNESELILIASVFEKLYNDSCHLATVAGLQAESVSNVAVSALGVHNKTNKFVKLGNATRAAAHVNAAHSMCAPNNNNHSLSKCEMVMRERATLLANSTRTMDIIKVLCVQIQLWRERNAAVRLLPLPSHQRQNNKSNSVPNILNRNVNNLGKNQATTTTAAAATTTVTTTVVQGRSNDDDDGGDDDGSHANQFSATSSEFVNLIPNQMDAEFSEYFPFFDFIVTKLVLSHNLTVNYNNQSGSSFVTAAPNASATPPPPSTENTFDFCVLELHVSQASSSIGQSGVDGNPNRNRINNASDARQNRTHITTTFVWRPVLILRQNELHQNIFVTHPLLPYRYPSWFFDNTHKFWTCGLLCWILAGIVILLLVCILVASITFGLAIRWVDSSIVFVSVCICSVGFIFIFTKFCLSLSHRILFVYFPIFLPACLRQPFLIWFLTPTPPPHSISLEQTNKTRLYCYS